MQHMCIEYECIDFERGTHKTAGRPYDEGFSDDLSSGKRQRPRAPQGREGCAGPVPLRHRGRNASSDPASRSLRVRSKASGAASASAFSRDLCAWPKEAKNSWPLTSCT